MPTRRSGCRRNFVRHALTISNQSSVGATRVALSSSSAILSASGSSNMIATRDETSMTLSPIALVAHLADNLGRFAGHIQVQFSHLRQELHGRHSLVRAHRLL